MPKDIAKLNLEQFPLDEILNEDDRVARGWMSVEIKDVDEEIIPISELKKTLNTLMKRGGFITDQHTNRVVGKILTWKEGKHEKSNKDGIIIDYQIFKDYSIDNEVWDEIKSKKRKGLSFGGRALDKPKMKTDIDSGDPAKELRGIEAYEVASVREPANELSENVAVNFMAKSGKEQDDTQLTTDLQKGFNAIDIQKPFAGFKDFDACVISQTERGHSEESSKRICGWLKVQTEKSITTQETEKNIVIKKLQDLIASMEANNELKELAQKMKTDIQTLSETVIKGSETKEVDTMTNEKKKKEEEKPDKKPEDEEDETKKATLETKMDTMIGLLEKVLDKSAKKDDDEEDDDEEDDEKKKSEDADTGDADASDGDSTESTDSNTDTDSEDADTDDTDADTDKSKVTKSDIDKLVTKQVTAILKEKGITTTKTPRAKTDIIKNKASSTPELAMDFINKAKEGKVDIAGINKSIKQFANKSKADAYKAVFGNRGE